MSQAKEIITDLLKLAGVEVNGQAPGDIIIRDERFYERVLGGGSLALGESYMDGWWEAEPLDLFFFKILSANLEQHLPHNWDTILLAVYNKLFNLQSRSRAFIVGEKHYDIGNDLYRAMLDKRLVYTCAYWKNQDNLDAAQEAKLDLVCRKLNLKPGMKLLDIGCGWGSLAQFAAERYGVSVVGLTVSREQVNLIQERCAGLPVEVRLQDYREVTGEYDAIASLGMFEHVGSKNYRVYMEVVRRCLKDHGLFLLHTIGRNHTSVVVDPWINKYIFPNNLLPSPFQITKAAEGLFTLEDWHNFGVDYDKTLLSWHDNFIKHWDELKGVYDKRFYRMWRYYLLSCAAVFRARQAQLWQIVFSKDDLLGGYQSIR